MKKVYAVISVLGALLLVPGLASANTEVEADADLDGSQVVPAVVTEMEGDFSVEIENGELEFTLAVANNTTAVGAAHIHCGSPGSNGPPGILLSVGAGVITEVNFNIGPGGTNLCGWDTLADVAADLVLGNTYVQVHTAGVPAGEIRGDLPSVD